MTRGCRWHALRTDLHAADPGDGERACRCLCAWCVRFVDAADDMTVGMLLVEDAVAFVFGNALSLDRGP